MRFITLFIFGTLFIASPVMAETIEERWRSLGGANGPWGAPNSEQTPYGDKYHGAFQNFRAGGVVWSPATGAHLVNNNEILSKWNRLVEWIGYPETDVSRVPRGDGYYMHCQYGSIYTRIGSKKAYEVHGEIRNKWAALGWEQGRLGYPDSDEFQDGPYRRSNFQFGYIRWTPKEGAREFITGQPID